VKHRPERKFVFTKELTDVRARWMTDRDGKERKAVGVLGNRIHGRFSVVLMFALKNRIEIVSADFHQDPHGLSHSPKECNGITGKLGCPLIRLDVPRNTLQFEDRRDSR
ncbi:MAG: hypothetical protein IH628_07565, partial [Proteobacteria bacterium]|nr:hypothetical protein [Pseudomonadota bacterium]